MTTLEDEVEALLLEAYADSHRGKLPTPEKAAAIFMRAGTGGEVARLQDAGDVAGITRERMRQIMNKVQRAARGKSLNSLRTVAMELVRESPVPEPIGGSLCRNGLTRPTLTGKALLGFFDLIGSSPEEVVGRPLNCVNGWLVEGSEAPVMGALAEAKRQTSSYGMTTVEEIRLALATASHMPDPEDIKRLLDAEPSVRWAGHWLWVEKNDNVHANRLVNTARSILSVNAPQSAASIHEGCRRVWKFRKLDVLPPASAMQAFFEASPYFRVDEGLVSPTEPLDYRQLLGEVSGSMIDVLKSTPHQIMDRYSLAEACEEAGISSGTHGIWTTYAEWMEHFGPAVWGLRGSNPSPAVVRAVRDAARARSSAEARRREWWWGPDGSAIQVMYVRTPFLSSGVMTFAPGLHEMLAGQSLELDVNGQRAATVKVGEGHPWSWGWLPALRATQAGVGDVAKITVDLTSMTARLEIGTNNLWDRQSLLNR